MRFNQGANPSNDAYAIEAYYHNSSSNRKPRITIMKPAHAYERKPLRISSELSPFPKHDPPQTVEQLVTDGYFSLSKTEPELALIDDRQRSAWMGLDDTIAQIQVRQDIYKRHMDELLMGECYAFRALSRGGFPPSEEQYANYNRQMQDLSMQRRAERVSFWRDVSRLRQAIPENLQQYLGALRKSQILGDTPGDLL